MAHGAIRLPLTRGSAPVLEVDADASTRLGQGPFGRTLRVALAMKGGVSLAVWIGGAVAELDVLRRVRLTGSASDPEARLLVAWRDEHDVLGAHAEIIPRATAYAQLLVSRRYDAVELDVLAGASAGGLNAVMYGVAQRLGAATDDILDVWRSSGDIWKLLRPGGAGSVDSVLQGDDYFWGEMRDALTALGEEPHLLGPPPQVSIDLSATVIDGQASRERGTREGRAHFHFSGGTDTDLPGRMIPARDDPEIGVALERLAYAARSTSSFPGAFEPARIYSGVAPAPAGAVDMREAFHAHRLPRPRSTKDALLDDPVTDPFRVVDGGVTDNVPIERALRAVRRRRADYYVDRALLYLDPSPELELAGLLRPTAHHGLPPSLRLDPDRRRDRADPRSALLSAVPRAIGMKAGQESKDDEVDDVERYRRLLYLEQAKDELFASVIAELFDPARRPPSTRGGGDPADVAAAYARFRSGADHDLLAQALVEPAVWRLPTALPGGAEHRGWSREELVRLDHTMFARFGQLAPDEQLGVGTGAQAQVDACRCLIAWVRALEDAAFHTIGIARLDELWGTPADAGGRQWVRRELHTVHSAALASRDDAIEAVLDAADDLGLGDTPVDPEALAQAITSAWLSSGNQLAAAAPEWEVLDALVDALRPASRALTEALAPVPEAGWAQSPWAGISRKEPLFGARDLAPLVAARGIPVGMPAMKYEDITAEESGNAEAFPALLEAQMLAGYRNLLQLRAPDARELTAPSSASEEGVEAVDGLVVKLMPRDRLRASTKLAGTGVANFAGFLSEEWRTNDWWWGRLDAAQGVVALLASLRAFDLAPDAEALRARAEGSVLQQWWVTVPDSGASLDAFRECLGSDAGGIAALEPSYRVAVASRLVRLLSRAVVRGAAWLAPQRVAMWLSRPLLVLVPAALEPARAAVVAALALLPVFLLLPADAEAGPVARTAAWLVALYAVALVLVDGTKRAHRTAILRQKLGRVRAAAVAPALRRSAVAGVALGAAATGLAAAGVWLLEQAGRIEVLVWVLLLASLALAIAARARFLVPRVRSGHGHLRASAGYVAAAGIVAAGWSLRGEGQLEPVARIGPYGLAVVFGAVGLLVAAALTAGWLVGFARQAAMAHWLEGATALVVTALLSGIAAGAPFLLLLLREQAPTALLAGVGGWATVTGCALAASWLWGTVLWWVPAIWQPRYRPSDRPRRR